MGTWIELPTMVDTSSSPTDTPLGLIAEAEYSQCQLKLEVGDMVLAFTDAVTESVDQNGRLLGQQGLLRLLRSFAPCDAADVIPIVASRLRKLDANNMSQDDATLLLFQATSTRPSLRDNLFAPIRWLGSVNDRTKLN